MLVYLRIDLLIRLEDRVLHKIIKGEFYSRITNSFEQIDYQLKRKDEESRVQSEENAVV